MQIPNQKEGSNSKQLTIPANPIVPTRGDPENKPFKLSFKYYNEKLCGIKDLEKNNSKKMLEHIKKIGLSNPDSLNRNGINTINVYDKEELSDILKEIKIRINTINVYDKGAYLLP